MRGPFFISLGLHVALGLLMVWASGTDHLVQKALPAATVVKLIRPMAPPPGNGAQSKAAETLESKPLQIPAEKKDKKGTKPAETEKPALKKTETPKPTSTSGAGGKELVGQAGTLRLAGGGFEYDFYLAVVQSKIEQNFRPPPGLRSQNVATVAFSIQKSGQVTGVALAKSSGNLLIDQAAVRAIRAAGMFPPLPPQYDKGQLDIYFEFVVNPASNR
jgi:protein TonB